MRTVDRSLLGRTLVVALLLAGIAISQVSSTGVPPVPKSTPAGTMAGRPPGTQHNPPQFPPGP
jgi:hypothetical protein